MKKAAASSGMLGSAGKWFTALITTFAALAGLLANAQSLGLTSWLGSVDLGIAAHAARRIVVAPKADTLLAIGDIRVGRYEPTVWHARTAHFDAGTVGPVNIEAGR